MGFWPKILGNLGVGEACSDVLVKNWPKKVGFWPFLRGKSGHEKSGSFSENGLFWPKNGLFWPFCAKNM